MSNENTYKDNNCKFDEIPQNADYVHNSSTSVRCCDNDKCECHHPLRLWVIKYEVVGVAKFSGVAVVQAKDLRNAQYVFIQNSKFNGFREYIHILCIEELYPNPEPIILLEDSAAIIDRHNLKSYPFLLKSDYEQNIQNISDNVIEAVEDYIKHNLFQQVNADWDETDETSKAYILNKPEIPDAQVQSNWNETDTNSKAYIQNKPEIPDAQIQADWNETDTSSKAFILNKPTIPEEQVNADWDSESGKSQILNKPTDLVHTSDIEGLLKNDGSVYTGKYLEQVEDLDNFQAEEGKIVQYIGETNSRYTNGYVYKKFETQTVIPSGTVYLTVNDNTGELAKVGIPNGIYYYVKTDTDHSDPIAGRIRYYGMLFKEYGTNETIGYVPVRYVEKNGQKGRVVDLGLYGFFRNKLLKVIKVTNLTSNGFIQFSNLDSQSSYVKFEDNSGDYIRPYSDGNDTDKGDNPVIFDIYENENGLRVYTVFGGGKVTPIEYNDALGTYQVMGDLKIGDLTWSERHVSSGETIIEDKWQQWDVQPRDDTSHFITDSEIGWIEH